MQFLIIMFLLWLSLIICLSKVDVSFFIALIFAVVFSLICINLFIILQSPYDFGDCDFVSYLILFYCIPLATLFIIKLIISIVKILRSGRLNNWRNSFVAYYRVYADNTESRFKSIYKFAIISYLFSAIAILLFFIFTSKASYSFLFWYIMFSFIAAGLGVAAFFNSIVIYPHLKAKHKVLSILSVVFSIPLFVAYYFMYAMTF